MQQPGRWEQELFSIKETTQAKMARAQIDRDMNRPHEQPGKRKMLAKVVCVQQETDK
jgi:hypothetical protein